MTHQVIFYNCNAAIAAGRVLQSFRGFLPKAVTQTQSSLFPPLTAFRWPTDICKALDRFKVMTVRYIEINHRLANRRAFFSTTNEKLSAT